MKKILTLIALCFAMPALSDVVVVPGPTALLNGSTIIKTWPASTPNVADACRDQGRALYLKSALDSQKTINAYCRELTTFQYRKPVACILGAVVETLKSTVVNANGSKVLTYESQKAVTKPALYGGTCVNPITTRVENIPPPPPPIVDMPPANPGNDMPYIDREKLALIPRGVGYTTARLNTNATYLPLGGNGTGAFRVDVGFSHFAFDDPIVKYGLPGTSHLHVFFGATDANAYTTSESLKNCKSSTSEGGILNCSLMWTPAVIDTAAHVPVVPDHLGVYYKCLGGDFPGTACTMPPAGLQLVWGNPVDAKGPSDYWGQHPYWVCNVPGQDTIQSETIPDNCPMGAELVAHLDFPHCWDNKNLSSPTHDAHMTFEPLACPASHPTILTNISYLVVYRVTSPTKNWRLSSDNYKGGPGGYSMHGDYFGAWDQPTEIEWMTNCVASGGDCSHWINHTRALF